MDADVRRSERNGEQSAAVLRDRLRRGDLNPERVELAAVLGFQPAREALGLEEPFVPFATPEDLALALRPYGQHAWLRAADICLQDQERVLVALGGQKRREIAAGFADHRATIRAYLERPGPETKRALDRVSRLRHPRGVVQIARRSYGPSNPAALNRTLTEALVTWALGSD